MTQQAPFSQPGFFSRLAAQFSHGAAQADQVVQEVKEAFQAESPNQLIDLGKAAKAAARARPSDISFRIGHSNTPASKLAKI